MKLTLRKQAILDRLNSSGETAISDLAKEFGLSEMTIRRDLETLELDGFVRRVRGGAIPSQSRSYEPPHITRTGFEHEAKIRIGRAAAALLSDNETAIIDGGTTTLELARAIDAKLQLTLITSSILIASELSAKPNIRTIVTGGILRRGEMSLIGARAENSFSDLNCDSVFLGVAGISSSKGLTEYNLDDTRVKQEAIKAGSRVVVLADATKIGKIAFANVAPIDVVDILITNASPNNKEISQIRDAGIEVIHVEPIQNEEKNQEGK
jgi:DeoR/GlpR family transcriptional regulator of sugar metabolism